MVNSLGKESEHGRLVLYDKKRQGAGKERGWGENFLLLKETRSMIGKKRSGGS